MTTTSAISLGSKPPAERDVPIACTLAPSALRGRLVDWEAVLVAAEHDCCQFLDFTITVDPRGIALEVTAPADGLSVVESLFGGAA